MNKAYDKVVWVNAPSTSSPLNQTNLNKMSNALDTIDDRVIDLDSGKVGSVTVTNTLPTGTTLATITVDGTATTIKGSDITVDDEMSTTSENPVQNKVIYETLQSILPEETAEGNPISISDASGLNAKSCEISFSPIQDLHGQSAPYPAGVGKNLAKPYSYSAGITSYDGNGNVTISGTVQASSYVPSIATAITEGFFLTLPAGTYKPSTEKELPNGLQLNVMRKNNQPISTGDSFTLTEETEVLIRVAILQGGTYNWTSGLMLEVGSQATDYAPYSNICPISGWTELNVARYGINLATTTIYKQGYVLNSDGTETVSTNYCITEKVPVNGGSKYILRFKENSGELSDNAIRIGFYKADGTFKSRSVLINRSPAITIENDVAFLCFSYVNASTSANYKWDLMFNEGETPLDYVPYQGQTHTATLGSTYYGGSYDFVSGKLIVEWVAVDMGSIDYVVSESGKFRYMPSNGIISDGVGNPANDFMCSIYKNQTNVVISSANVANLNVAKTSSPTYASYYFRNDNYSTKEAFKTAMSGQTFCYKLATPLEITLTAHEIALLKGQNVLWSDSNGNITLTYSADIKAYIDSKISQLS